MKKFVFEPEGRASMRIESQPGLISIEKAPRGEKEKVSEDLLQSGDVVDVDEGPFFGGMAEDVKAMFQPADDEPKKRGRPAKVTPPPGIEE